MKHKYITYLVVVAFICIGIIHITPSIKAIEQEKSTTADKDTYVSEIFPDSNYGDEESVLVGCAAPSYFVESYIHFSFAGKPANYIKAEISFSCWLVVSTFNVSVCIVEESWNEATMTWANKPDKAQNITTLTISSTKRCYINITNYVEGRTGISICIYIAQEDFIDDWFAIHSSECNQQFFNPPKLTWTYEVPNTITITNPFGYTKAIVDKDLEITWTTQGEIEHVQISAYKGSIEKYLITNSVDNSGSFTWRIPKDANPGHDWQIKITNVIDPTEFDYSDNFEIATEPPPLPPPPSPPSSPTISGYLINYMLIIFASTIVIVLFEVGRKRKDSLPDP